MAAVLDKNLLLPDSNFMYAPATITFAGLKAGQSLAIGLGEAQPEGKMGFLKRIGGTLGFIAFLTPCIIAGIYASHYNTASTMAGWGVGIGVALIEGAIIMVLAKRNQQVLLLGIGAILIGALPSYYWIARPKMALGPFNAHLQEYLAAASATNPNADVPLAGQLLQGKLIPVDMKEKTIDPVFFDLSSDLKPEKPEEIGAIAAMWWEEEQIGTYGGKGGAYQEHCTVTVLDKSTGMLLAEKSFTGPMPPSTSQNGASQTGDKPYKEIQEYLNGLAHH
jgi:hypothetical protein